MLVLVQFISMATIGTIAIIDLGISPAYNGRGNGARNMIERDYHLGLSLLLLADCDKPLICLCLRCRDLVCILLSTLREGIQSRIVIVEPPAPPSPTHMACSVVAALLPFNCSARDNERQKVGHKQRTRPHPPPARPTVPGSSPSSLVAPDQTRRLARPALSATFSSHSDA